MSEDTDIICISPDKDEVKKRNVCPPKAPHITGFADVEKIYSHLKYLKSDTIIVPQ